MEYCRLQIGCLLIVGYIGFMYFRECKRYHKKINSSIFDKILVLSMLCIIFDGITAITVNNLETVMELWNKVLHLVFLIGIDSVVYMLFGYMLKTTGALPGKRRNRFLLHIPYFFNVVVVVVHIGSLEFRTGVHSNYSMGIAAYTCFAMVGIYILLSLIVFFKRWNYIECNKRMSILTFLLAIGGITTAQAIFPEILLSSVAVTLAVVGIYLNQEDPALNEISRYHSEMVMSFATLVENKDGSTGGHIKRSTAYVKLLAEELRNRGYYKGFLTKDYIRNLCQADQCTTSGKLQYRMLYYKNREGLPRRSSKLLKSTLWTVEKSSEKRCYRDAMSLEQCFAIIEQGSSQDFNPLIAEVFLECREKVEQIHNGIRTKQKEEIL